MIPSFLNSTYDIFENIGSKVQEFPNSIQYSIFNVFKSYIKFYFLNAPKKLGGFEGAEPHDICHLLTGLSSSHFLSSENNIIDCYNKMENTFNAYTVAFIFIMVNFITLIMLWNFFPIFKGFLSLLKGSFKATKSKADKELTKKKTLQTEAFKIIAKKYISFLSNSANYNFNDSMIDKLKEEISDVLNTLPSDEHGLEYQSRQILSTSDSYRVFFGNRISR